MKKTMMALAVGWMLTTLAGVDPLEKFWYETKGQTIRRLPVQIVPENVFQSLSEVTFAEPPAYTRQFVKDLAAQSTYNVVTLTLRSIPDLSDKITEERVQDFIRTAHGEGLQVLMDIDPRIARFEFLRRWPESHAGILHLGLVAPTNGVAAFDLVFGNYRDHMAWGSRAAYATLESRVVDAFAVKMAAAGRPDWSTRRDLTAAVQAAATCVSNRVTGALGGLAADERLVVAAHFKLLAADPCAPAITPFLKELALRYKALGADGAMRDEWGFPPMRNEWRSHAVFHFTPRFAALYAAHLPGHDYLKDMELVVVDPQAEAARTAIDAMGRTIYDRIVQTECEFYDLNKEIFGPDVYVTKHPTWHTYFSGTEFLHNGLDWWGAKRDWAQSDEGVPISCICGMAKKMGGPCWMNEGYGPNPEHYGRAVWKYALTGGRMVYHGIYGGNSSVKRLNLPPAEAKRRTALDILRPENVRAQARVRLLNLISRAQIDCPTALVFGHRRLMNWTDAAYQDGGLALAHALGDQGHYVDAYPSTEFELDTFRVDAEGYLAVGAQRYTALVLHRLDAADAAAFARIVKDKPLKTALFSWDSPSPSNATALASPSNAAPIVAVLEKAHATKQTPLTARGLHHYSTDHLPDTAGTLRLLDGTVVRIKACQPYVSGDTINETLDTGHGKVSFQADGGLFAVRFDAKGEIEALAAGGLRTVSAKNLRIKWLRPGEDIALVRKDGKWRGLWQTRTPKAPIPEALKALTDDWRILALPSSAPAGGYRERVERDREDRVRRIAPPPAGEMTVRATFCSAGWHWTCGSEVKNLRAEFRKVGASAWQEGLPSEYFPETQSCRASFVYLAENTDYEMRLVADGQTLKTATFRTWSSDVPVAKTVELDPATFHAPCTITAKGSPEGWIRYVVKGGKLQLKEAAPAFVLDGAQYVLLDDMTVRSLPEARYVVDLKNTKDVRIRNCDFAGWGRVGTPDYAGHALGKPRAKGGKGETINYDGAVNITRGCENTVVERCYIHDCATSANSWRYSHPAGGQAVVVAYAGPGTVLRYNDFVGSDRHRWNDAVEGPGNFDEDGGINRDADVYGNFMIFCNDDNIELDGGQLNVRCFRNRFENALCGVSIQGCMDGPSYVFDNAFTGGTEEFSLGGAEIKTSGVNLYGYYTCAYLFGNEFWLPYTHVNVGDRLMRFVLRDNKSEGDSIFENLSSSPKSEASGNVGKVPFARDGAIAWPYRPVPFTLDRGLVEGVKTTSAGVAPATVAITATVTGKDYAMPFTIAQNADFDWFSVSPAQGVLKSGEKVVFTLAFDAAKMKDRHEYRGAFLVRTADGFSRPVSVYAEGLYENPAHPEKAGLTAVYQPWKGSGAYTFDVPRAGTYFLLVHVRGADKRIRLAAARGSEKPARADVGVRPYWTWQILGFNLQGDSRSSKFALEAGPQTFTLNLRDGKLPAGQEFDEIVLTDNPGPFEPR